MCLHEDDRGVLTDAQLIDAASSDPAAFRELYERHVHRIYGFHLRRRDAERIPELPDRDVGFPG